MESLTDDLTGVGDQNKGGWLISFYVVSQTDCLRTVERG